MTIDFAMTQPILTGIILFAHGSRDAQWRLPIEAVAANIQARSPAVMVRCAYLELCEPTLPEAATVLLAAGTQKIRVMPLFLGVGKHAREDLPVLITQIQKEHPEAIIELMPAVGENPALIALMAEIALAPM